MSANSMLAVHSLDRFDLSLPDLDEAERFYAAFGLNVLRSHDELLLSAHASEHKIFKVTQGGRKKFLGLTFGVYEEDLPRFERRFEELGLRPTRVRDHMGSERLSIRDPDGTTIELAVAAKTTPSSVVDARALPRKMAPKRSLAPPVRPTRFSHLLLFTADVTAAVKFYSDAFGLRLSDRSGNEIAFLHTPHGGDHHLVAFVKSTGPGLHHSSWDVASIDDVGLGQRQLSLAGYGRGWGVGRHVLGSNYFFYAEEPWGGYIEYSFDMDFIAGPSEWVAGDHEAEDAFFVWGPQPPEGFADNTEIEPGDKHD